jgi:hypothetical protein
MWRGQLSPKRETTQNSFRAMDVRLTTLESFACTMLKIRTMVINLDRLTSCVVTARDKRAFEWNSGRGWRVITGRNKHSPRKERNGDTDKLLGTSSLEEGAICYISPRQKL